MTAIFLFAGGQRSNSQPADTPATDGQQEFEALKDAGEQEEWDPTLLYDYSRLKERLESILAIEDRFGFLVAYWELVGETHRAFPNIYFGDRAVLSPDFFLLRERLPDGGWILLDSADPANDRKKHEISADGGLYIVRKNQVIRVGEVEDGDTVFVATKGGAGVVTIDDGVLDIGVIPTVSARAVKDE